MMMKFVVFAALIAMGAAVTTRLGEKRCTWGPSYWCDKYSNAIKCNAVEHCKSNVWKGAIKGSECDTCKEVLTYMHTILADKTSQGLMIDALEEVCMLLPSSYQAECKSLLTTYGTEIIQVIAAYTSNPNELCSLMGMCTASPSSVPLMRMMEFSKIARVSRLPLFGPGPVVIPSKPVASNSAECILCEYVMSELETMVTAKSTTAEIEAALDKVCSFLPSTVQNECTAFINTYTTQIVQLLVKAASPKELCTLLQLCTAQESTIQVEKPMMKKEKPVHAGELCEVCQVAMGYLKSQLANNATESEIIAALESVCSYVPSSLKDECDSLVESYGKQILQLLLAELTPSLICKELGLCTSAGVKVFTEIVKQPLQKKQAVKAGELCQVCELAMGYLKSQLTSNATETEIVEALEAVCNYLPSSIKSECDSLVQTYSREIITLILAELSPDLVCKELGLCTSTGVKILPSFVKKTKAVKAGEFCQVCELAMGFLKNQLSSNATESEIVAAMEQVCSYLPSSFKTECDALVTEYGREIINLLLKELDPATVCTELGLCTSANVKKVMKLSKLIKKESVVMSGVTCEVCEVAMGYLKSALSSEATVDEITKAVETLCTVLPSSVQAECDGLIAQYGKMIINLIVSSVTPDEVCKELGLCSSQRSNNETPVLF